MTPENNTNDGSEFLLYQTNDGQTRVQVRMLSETVWLTQRQMAELFDKDVRTISEHIQTTFAEGEVERDSVIRNFRITAADGKKYTVEHYNLDVIISVGYRVRSLRGTQFRQWATARLREYIIKGFALDDQRLKEGGRGADYFEELLLRIRDIRASEKRFYQKVCDIYATSVDYDKNDSLTQEFFQMVQNKLHFAVHGRTAAEMIAERADAAKPNMGLTTWKNADGGGVIRKADTDTAKNYLTEDELNKLRLIVDQYLSFAEFQAQHRQPMTMADWKAKLDAFLTLNGCEILTHFGGVSAAQAKEKAAQEFARYEAQQRQAEAAASEQEFDQLVKNLKNLPPV